MLYLCLNHTQTETLKQKYGSRGSCMLTAFYFLFFDVMEGRPVRWLAAWHECFADSRIRTRYLNSRDVTIHWILLYWEKMSLTMTLWQNLQPFLMVILLITAFYYLSLSSRTAEGPIILVKKTDSRHLLHASQALRQTHRENSEGTWQQTTRWRIWDSRCSIDI